MEEQSSKNAEPSNWDWDPEDRDPWKLADTDWQEFCANWNENKGNRSAPLFDLNLPHLPLESMLSCFLPSISSSIFVRKSYQTMFDTIWKKAISTKDRRGVIITGQPGIGKSLFDYYLLVRLLLQKQVILFSPEGKDVYLFYFGKVYKSFISELAPGGRDISLPRPVKFSLNVFMWSVFDILENKEPESFMYNYPCFPVQTTSPDEGRYKTWRKFRSPLVTALPLWTREELVKWLKYQKKYKTLMDALSEAYGPPLTNDISGALKDFPGPCELLRERYGEEDAEPPSPEDALDYLLDAAINRFGYSARDVYGGIFDYQDMTKAHENAFHIRYEDLQSVVSTLARTQSDSSLIEADWILALSPVYLHPLDGINWKLDFKSDWAARSVIWRLGEAENVICQQVKFYKKDPRARELAGQFLEPLAHRYIAQTAADDPWPLITMVSNDADPPNFTLARDSPVEGDIIFPKIERKIVKLESTADLPACLGNNRYYVPIDPNFPFDAFTIEIDYAKKFAILWILQMSTSRRRGGSTMGYQKIREIIATLKERLLDEPPLAKKKKIGPTGTSRPLMEVRYLLVVPKDKSELENLHWQFPKGWSEKWKKNDHRGKVYCLEFPLSEIYNEE